MLFNVNTKIFSHISHPKSNELNLLMQKVNTAIKETFYLLKDVFYVAKKVFLLN